MKNKNSFCIILAGGVGKRLWPCSRREKPKQFLDLLGTGRTLLQTTFDRMLNVFPVENIYISTFNDYRHYVEEQLPELDAANVLCEPLQLSSAPAVAWACLQIGLRCPDANILVSPCDQFIQNEDQFCADVERALDFVSQSETFVALGVPATQPNQAYGYIQKGHEAGDGRFTVKSFTEKPDLEFAKLFVQSKEFYWNTGLFLWNVRLAESLLKLIMPEAAMEIRASEGQLTSETLQQIIYNYYQTAGYSSIDLIVLEKGENVVVQPCTFGWADIGNWTDLHAVEKKDEEGNAVIGKAKTVISESRDNLVAIPDGTTAIIHGLDGYLVALHGKTLVICPNNDPALVRMLFNEAQVTFGDL